MIRILSFSMTLLLFPCIGNAAVDGPSFAVEETVIFEVEKWTKTPQNERGDFLTQPFAKTELTRQQAETIAKLLWQDFAEMKKAERKLEWDNRTITLEGKTMKFARKVFGEKPKSGRRLFISMHGGGNAPARVNEQQWRNQIRLYQPDEGVYVAPRAPTDTWNMWHESHIDKFFKRIINDAVLFEGVNPNRVYLMGYSAGGDGVYQLAPRMADSIAAAAMMAGHPNNASPLGLRNIGFTIHMGGKDSAYNRNKIAEQWKIKLAELQKSDPGGYQHEVTIHQNMGHWMKRKDAVAVPWMSKFTRDPNPEKIVWNSKAALGRNYYWLAIPDEQLKNAALTNMPDAGLVVVGCDDQTINIEAAVGIEELELRLNDEIVDLAKTVFVKPLNGQKQQFSVKRYAADIYRSINHYEDPTRVYYSTIRVKTK